MACKVSAEKSVDSLMGFPLNIMHSIPLAAFEILSLSFALLIMMCLGVDLFGYIFFGTISFPMLGKFTAIISSNKFSAPFFLSPPSEILIMQMLVCLILSQRFLKLSSFFFFLIF